MTDPVRSSPVRTPGAHRPPPPDTMGTGPAAHAAPVLELLDGVDAPRSTRGTRPQRCESPTQSLRRRSVDRAIDALVQGDHARFDELVQNDTRTLGALGRLSDDELQRRIGAAFERAHTGLVDRLGGNYFATMRAVGRAADRVKAAFREMVRNEAKLAVEDLIRQIDTMDPAAITESLRGAEPGTPEYRLAQSLGVFGEPGDADRLEGEIDQMVQSLRTFHEHLIGNTWEASDFPETTRRVLCSLGVSRAPEGSLLDDAIEGVRPLGEAAHQGVVAADAGMSVYEVSHAVGHHFAATASAGAAIETGGLVLGLAIHHAVEAHIEDRRELAQEIGL